MTAPGSVIEVKGLSVVAGDDPHAVTLVDGVDLAIGEGEILGVVGESGAGKSMTALAMTRMLPAGVRMGAGTISFDGTDLAAADARTLRSVRGGRIGMVFQDPLSSLNPTMTVRAQIAEALRLHGSSRGEARRRAAELLALVGIREPGAAGRYPHEFSGGMRQRVMIAIAVANNPRLLIADEPTTGLDVTIQAEVLALLTRLRDELGTAIMLITHDIGVVEQLCDRVTVLYGGRVAETGRLGQVTGGPRHPYTWQLIRSVPRLDDDPAVRLPAIPGAPPDPAEAGPWCLFASRCAFAEDRCRREEPALRARDDSAHAAACFVINDAGRDLALDAPIEPAASIAPVRPPAHGEPIVEVREAVVDYHARARERHPDRVGPPAVDGVSLSICAGQVLGIVGESGSGKSSLARAIVGLESTSGGSVAVDGRDWGTASAEQRASMRRTVQLVFQDPLASMNPRWRVRQILAEPLRVTGETERTPEQLLELVGLGARLLERYPDELSGGQRQRVGIARALAVRPRVIVADEPVSALDVSVQAQVINVLSDLRDEFHVGLVFVAHDLAVARHICDEVAVMYRGRIVEQGPAETVLRHPRDPYTIRLVDSVPGRRRPAVASSPAAGEAHAVPSE
jgi:peptide/nickel transport system ATP-binding protein